MQENFPILGYYISLTSNNRLFLKYALLPVSQYVHWMKIGYVQNAVNLSKIFFFGI